ncbi:nucleotide exchange factor GrpE [Clostridium botulinum]|uniref:Protein GrpE n=1 Tax=Clostridium botulinum (strain Eklund 17B / Type B) TaxID=935198 RepID=B2TLZ6_CLOBB|nr:MULTISPECIES: nucleotide exchange factor GrpE [Clostridium]ACD23936.1 co-chaperone GrpE [Clostridium botulinum B str. Eklund 17B (NRP)]AIY79549.1 grpE family protein [Clostridium botulinum 202F]KAI3348278.1 nucleotide exchange factor GrpE [Clostridium botulinum]KFX57966.1 heat shock protein GrpE [Clostridium botulinum]KFX58856.1 heat shock protein GrpE [Clostridium botulinum]
MEYNDETLKNEEVEETIEEVIEENEKKEDNIENNDKENLNDESSKESLNEEEDELSMMKKHKVENEKLKQEIEALNDRVLRITAEYDNYRKRTTKEKQGIYSDACVDVLKELVPVLDNLERAVAAEGSLEDLKKGVEMTIKSCQSSFEKLGVEEIDASADFDPNLHQAVMHIEDENIGKNQIAEVFLKGYKKEDKVIRYTVVKVAN